MEKRMIAKGFLYIAVFMVLASAVMAAGEIVQMADRLNYWGQETHVVTVSNTETLSTNVSIIVPAGWTLTGTSGSCSQVGSDVECILAGGGSGTYTVQSPSSGTAEYEVDIFTPTTNNTYTGNNVSMVKIQCSEIFHTLVEYGRGRGNYFYNSNSGRAGSGQTGTGCSYLPNGTFIELNFLHKVYNVKQYFNVVADAYNATYTCTYPNDTIVRQHLDTSITRGADWTVDFLIDEIGGSWERFGYIGMQFDSGAYATGQSITINCTNIQYYLPVAGGNMSCAYDSFTLQFRDREPFTASASAAGTIYNGTQEVEITYTINNSELYDVSGVAIEIDAPQYATFIGTRGELWGTSLDTYRLEKTDFVAGESYTITLVARFDTTNAGSISSINLSEGIGIEYTTCWEFNAYNPTEYIQDITITDTATVNMAQATTITGVQDKLDAIFNLSIVINNTLYGINATIYEILNLSRIINASTWNISYNVWTYPSRNLTYYPPASVSGGTAGGSGAVACRWNTTAWYNDTYATNTILVYNQTIARVDFPNIFNGTVDAWQVCHKTGRQAGTQNGDDLEIYVCNDYNGSANPHDDPKCTLIDTEDPAGAMWPADHLQWECDPVLTQEVSGTNISIIFKCDACSNASDAWKVVLDTSVDLNYTFNSSDLGTTWSNVTGEGLVDWSWCVPIDFGAEVWTYNNRTLTDYNFGDLLDQFNCSNNASTNKMCELLYTINLTTTNMQATINIINGTVNNIEGNVTLIYNDTQYLVDQLNCNGSTDTPICSKLDSMNSTLQNIWNLTLDINYTVNSINNSIYVMNQSIHNRFDSIDNNISILINTTNLIQDLVNCTNISAQSVNSTCNRLDRIETNTLIINSTVNSVLNIVNYINSTRWLNYSVQDILDAINNVSLSADLTGILTEIRRLREFDEELVFLVTDAFNAQIRAKDAAEGGDYNAALTNLETARSKLDDATFRLEMLKNATESEAADSGYWIVWLMLTVIIGAVVIFLFQKVPEEPPRTF